MINAVAAYLRDRKYEKHNYKMKKAILIGHGIVHDNEL